MAVDVMGLHIRIPQGDTGMVKFEADNPLEPECRALFTLTRRNGGVLLRKVLVPDEEGHAFCLPFVYSDTAAMKPDTYDWSIRVVYGGVLDGQGRLLDTQFSHTEVLCGRFTLLPVAGGAR